MPSLPQDAIQNILHNGNTTFLSLNDLEKALDSIEHPILLQSLFHARVNVKSWRLIRAWYSNISAAVRSASSISSPFPSGACSKALSCHQTSFWFWWMNSSKSFVKKTVVHLPVDCTLVVLLMPMMWGPLHHLWLLPRHREHSSQSFLLKMVSGLTRARWKLSRNCPYKPLWPWTT